MAHVIEPIELPEDYRLRIRQRCCKVVESTGTAFFDGNKYQCARHARFKIDGIKLCGQHAGEMALKIMLVEQAKGEA